MGRMKGVIIIIQIVIFAQKKMREYFLVFKFSQLFVSRLHHHFSITKHRNFPKGNFKGVHLKSSKLHRSWKFISVTRILTLSTQSSNFIEIHQQQRHEGENWRKGRNFFPGNWMNKLCSIIKSTVNVRKILLNMHWISHKLHCCVSAYTNEFLASKYFRMQFNEHNVKCRKLSWLFRKT